MGFSRRLNEGKSGRTEDGLQLLGPILSRSLTLMICREEFRHLR
jgi:hypothetical protein